MRFVFGFNALTHARPVCRVVYNPANRQASFTAMDFDLGDMPINTVAFDDVTGDLYAGTDFGPLVLRHDTTHWGTVGFGFPEALMVDLEIVSERRLLIAATHGLDLHLISASIPVLHRHFAVPDDDYFLDNSHPEHHYDVRPFAART
jgi:hypothetical protein